MKVCNERSNIKVYHLGDNRIINGTRKLFGKSNKLILVTAVRSIDF